MRTAVAKGLPAVRIIGTHALRNAAIPLCTIVGIDLGRMLAGATVVEIVFSRPGIGHLLIDALKNGDYPQIQGTIVFYVALIAFVNMLSDIAYSLLDPRVAYE
jgi:peptide/nickel transport system permease protein